MEKSVEQLNLMFDELQKSDFKTFDEVKDLKKIMGVYIIYSQDNEILYIGSTNNFFVRFGTDLRHESTHTLIRKLIKAAVHSDRIVARDYFTNHYKYKIYVCENKRKAEALEHLAIWILDPKYNHNYIPS
jgi:excinuclease UvrABC nuclease subunit